MSINPTADPQGLPNLAQMRAVAEQWNAEPIEADRFGVIAAGDLLALLNKVDSLEDALARAEFRIQLYEFKFEMLGLDKDIIAEQVAKIIGGVLPVPVEATNGD